MTQAWAILIDAYRELNARRMFWVAIVISLLIVLCFMGIGITEKGIQILWFEVPAFINTSIIPASTFYKFIFINFGIKVWLTFGATILALTSTSGMIPELVRSGSIEMVLSRPLGRLRLFLLKYLAGLLFVALQVFIFSLASFIVIGVRGQTWEWGLFLAIPIVVVFFSYLFSICVLVGLLTRSSTASLLITILLWLLIGGVHVAESIVLAVQLNQEGRVAMTQQDVTAREESVRKAADEAGRAGAQAQLDNVRRTLTERQADLEIARKWHIALLNTKTVLPKTNETAALLERWLLTEDEISRFVGAKEGMISARGGPRAGAMRDQIHAEAAAEHIQRDRPLGWVLGTSLAFEGVMLLIAGWIFCRKDF